MKYTINELANSRGVSQPVREALLQMADYKQLYEQVCEQYDILAKELEAINRQVEILSDALAESRREVAALKDVPETDFGNMTKDEALKLALEALGTISTADNVEWIQHKAEQAITAIKQARSAPVQEPVAWRYDLKQTGSFAGTSTEYSRIKLKIGENWTPLYTTPPAQSAPVQEPVAWVREHELPLAPGDAFSWVETFVHKTPLYTTPPSQPATEESSATQPAQPAPVQEPVLKDNSNYRLDSPEAELAQRQWVDPNDKTQEQYLPHIGEPVLFCHEGKTYMGKHTGGSFQSEVTNQYFNTWFCHWMYLPAAHGIKENT
jgi:flagellar biosynthesis chaperone FliJ